MLQRLDEINKLGPFASHAHSPGLEFGDLTLVYGENGVGKSTVAAVLDSLRENNPSEVLRRRSLPGDQSPFAMVTVANVTYVFDGTLWSNQPPHDTLDVFCPRFVVRNVHAGTFVDTDQRRNLCELVLGRKAVENVTRLAEADDEARSALTEKKRIDTELQLMVKKPDTLETFIGLSRADDIEEQLEQARIELRDARNRDIS